MYYEYDPEPEEWWNKHTGIPIGGWLILVGIGLTLQPLRIFADLLQSTDVFKPDTYESFFNSGQDMLAYVNMLWLGFNMASLAFSVLLAILFYEKRTSLPKIIVIYYFANLGITVLTSIAGIYYAANQDDAGRYYKDVFIILIVTAIWVPYFNTSRRVKETFVNRS